MQLIEIHDQPWCPTAIRDGLTDMLRFEVDFVRGYRRILPRILDALSACGTDEVVDLCSGAGGPWPGLTKSGRSGLPRRITLTDLYPNRRALASACGEDPRRFTFRDDPVDATDVPASLSGFRTLFNSFHHFPPEMARAILADAVDKGVGIGVFELTRRRPLAMMGVAAAGPLGTFLFAPWAKPFRLSRLFYTYVIPAIPTLIGVDGVVSCLRTYSPDELRELHRGLGERSYVWETAVLPIGIPGLDITYLIGVPSRG